MKKITHGTNSGYQHYKCRCFACRNAKREYEANRKKPKTKNIELVGPEPIEHGTFKAYSAKKCRCEICCAFMRGYNQGYGMLKKESASDTQLEEFETTLQEKARVCGTTESYSFGCTCDLCLTQGRQAWVKSLRVGAA